ncbi:MAG: quinol:electron acceptor oxidoreductase subunit ActD [Planctomycetaceae bacterium]
MPQPYHPLFNVSTFQAASRDRFFLCVESDDPKFRADETRRVLQSLSPLEVNDVPW